jgi:hypothetical protein
MPIIVEAFLESPYPRFDYIGRCPTKPNYKSHKLHSANKYYAYRHVASHQSHSSLCGSLIAIKNILSSCPRRPQIIGCWWSDTQIQRKVIGSSIIGCEISSQLDKKITTWSIASCALSLACRPSVSKINKIS